MEVKRHILYELGWSPHFRCILFVTVQPYVQPASERKAPTQLSSMYQGICGFSIAISLEGRCLCPWLSWSLTQKEESNAPRGFWGRLNNIVPKAETMLA